MIERRYIELPPDLVIDRLTAYVFRHYAQLLNADEHALARLHTARLKAVGSQLHSPGHEAERERFWRVDNLADRHPELHRRLASSSLSAEMVAARDRILRDYADQVVLNKCTRCGSLCLTPRAKACLECGHTWHAQEEPL